jgi:anhydro-N-acetylmuramic acid kinase
MDGFAPIWALGLMSGTSMDGIDAAIIETDGERVTAFGPATTTPYDEALRDRIRAALGEAAPDPAIARGLTDAHAACIEDLLSQHPEYKDKIQIVGLHGHTVLHAPADGVTVQIGDGPRLAARLGIDVVSDFRTADVAAGGQGAPFAPLYHRALCDDIDGPVVVLNIGGISNVTWISDAGIGGADADPVAFDTGPGNALLDDWIESTTDLPYDMNGQISGKGQIDSTTLAKLLDNPYFAAPPPKSLDRLDFNIDAVHGLSPEDGAATLARFTCETVVSNLKHLPTAPVRILVTGGGRNNPTLMAGLSELSGVPVAPVESVGWDGDAIEAQAFGFLAVRSLRGLPLSVPSTTGVPMPTTGGQLHHAA